MISQVSSGQVSSGQVYGAATVCGKREVASQVKGPTVIDIDQVKSPAMARGERVNGQVNDLKW